MPFKWKMEFLFCLFENNKLDKELLDLEKFLVNISEVFDVRTVIAEYFKLKRNPFVPQRRDAF